MIDKNLEAALSAFADYSSSFVEVVEELRASLSEALGVTFHRINDMNYSSSQTIRLMLNEKYMPVSDRHAATFWINTFVSSKGKFYFISCRARDTQPSRTWRIVPDAAINQEASSYVRRIKEKLEDKGYVSLPNQALSEIASNHRTQLDNLPATVFQVLFSELGP